MKRAAILAFAALAAQSAAQTDRQIAEFRTAAETVWNGNLPQLHAYLQKVDGTSLDAPAPPASAPAWSARPQYSSVCDALGCRAVMVRTAKEVADDWRASVDAELRRIAGEAPSQETFSEFEGAVKEGRHDSELSKEESAEAVTDISQSRNYTISEWNHETETAEEYLKRVLDELEK